MSSIISRIARFARSPQGRQAAGKAMRYARSPQGQQRISQFKSRFGQGRSSGGTTRRRRIG